MYRVVQGTPVHPYPSTCFIMYTSRLQLQVTYADVLVTDQSSQDSKRSQR